MNHYARKKILVTGGAGFIGSHLVEALVDQDADVTVIDNLSTGSLNNLAAVSNKIAFVEGDIRDSLLCKKVVAETDYIFHLAAQVSVPESMLKPEDCFSINVQGTFNLLEAARQTNIQGFIFSSSCAIYGNQTEPCVETMPCAPTSPYAYSKYSGELLCEQYSRCFSIPTLSLRYFNVVGERQNPSGPYAGVFAQFKDRMLKKESIVIFGDGTQSRDFIPVAEVVKANLLAGMYCKKNNFYSVVNVATGKSKSVNNLFYELKKELNYPYGPHYMPARVGDIFYSEANITLLNKLKES